MTLIICKNYYSLLNKKKPFISRLTEQTGCWHPISISIWFSTWNWCAIVVDIRIHLSCTTEKM